MIAQQQNQPTAFPAEGRVTPAAAQNAAAPAGDPVLIATVDPNQQGEFVGMSVDQLMQLDLYFVPGEDVPEKPLPAEEACPDGDEESVFASLEASTEDEGTAIAAANVGAVDLQEVEPVTESTGVCLGDLTELSLLELMNVRVEPKPTPLLPQLRPVDLDSLFDRTEDEQSDNNIEREDDGHSDTFVPPEPIEPGSTPSFNVPPVAGNDSYSSAEDNKLSVVTGGVLKNDTDGNGDTLSVSVLGTTTNGTLTLSSNGRFVYTPNADFNGKDSFTYLVSDGNGGFDTGSVTLTVTAVNDAPVLAGPGTVAVTEDTAAAITGISVTDVDAGTDAITVTLAIGSGGLAATSGSGVTVGGSAASLTLTGTLTDINAFLAGGNVAFTPALNNSNDVALTVTVNDKGNSGAGGAKSDSIGVTLDVQAVNDAPVVAVPGAGITVTEDVASNITGISFSDVDAGAGTVTVTLAITAGTLTGVSGGGVAVAGSGSGTVTLTGTIAAINSFIAGGNVAYTTALDDTTPQTLTATIDDGGNTGSGGAKTDSDTVTLNVTAVNDAPVLAVPGPISVTEDVSTVLTGISVTDVDVGTGNIAVTLSVPSGTLTATAGGGVTVSGSGTGTVTLTGTLADINTFLTGGVSYTTALNNDGDVALTVTVNDKGNTGTGGAKSDTEVVTLDVQAVNDAPVVAVPGAGITVTEDVASNITGINFSDVDAGAGTVTVTLAVTAGTLTGVSSGGVAVAGSGSGTVTLTGTITAINTFIGANNVTYTTALDDTAPQTLTATIDDGGNTGSGGAKTDSDTVTLNVTAVNDAPVLAVPGPISVNEDVSTILTGISVADVDAGTGNIAVTLSVPSGTLTATAAGGVTVSGSGTGSVTLTGTLADINAFLTGGVSYTTALNNDGDVALTVTVNDKGNTGTGGAKSDTEVVTLDVQAVNDAPVVAVPGAGITVTEDVASNITGISFSDVDAGAGTVTVTLAVTAGTLTGVSGAGVTVAGSGSGTMTLTGTIGAINSFIAGGDVDYTTALDDTTPQTLTATIDDGGNTGSGGAKTDSDTVTLNVTSVNDAPVLAVPGPISVNEDVSTVLTGISVIDVDAGTGTIAVTLSVLSGTLAATAVPGVAVTGSGTGSITLSGTLADINAFLTGGVSYTTALNNSGDVTLTVTANDQGNTGTGGAKSDIETVTLDVQVVNDAPVIAVPASPIVVTEDAASDITGISFSDVDAGSGTVTVTLSVTAGMLTGTSTAFVTVAGSGTGTVTLTGTISAINSFIAGGNVDYTTALNDTTPQTLTATIDDGGNTGAGGAKTDSDTVTLNVTAVNDAPVVAVPGAGITVTEDVGSAITGISFSDIDAGAGTVTVTLSVTAGTLAAGSTVLVTVGGSGTGSMTLTGTIADINAFIAGSNVDYTTSLNDTGAQTLTAAIDDGGNTGTGGAKTDSDTVTITVDAVNDAPVVAVPGGITVTEDVASNITGISFTDVDAGAGTATVTLAVTAGTLTGVSGGGVAVAGSGSGTVTLTGTIAAINSFIAANNVTYTTALNNTTPQTLTATIDDGGNTGSGGAKTDSDTVTLNVTAVNDAPVLTVPGTISVDEDVPTSLTGISVSDVDAGAGAVTVTLSVPSGTLAATTGGGVTVSGSATNLTLTGTLADINSFLGAGNVSYTTVLNNDGDVNLTVLVNDQGNAGTGGAKTDTESVTLDVQAVNDAPVVVVPGAPITVTENFASDITGITFSDIDAGTNNVTVTLSVSAGILTAASTALVTVGNSGTATITLTGTVSAVNDFISGGNVDFTTPLNETADQTLTVTINDGGNTGSGGAKSDSDTVTLTVTPVNSAPTDLALSNSKVDENAVAAVIGILTVTDPDTGDSHTLTVDDIRFEIIGNQLQLKAGESLDFETEPSVTVQVTAKDAGGLTYVENFVITVGDKTGSSIGGSAGNDSLDGTAEDDSISSFPGNDTLNGFGGGDTLDAGTGDDLLDGGAGNDSMFGDTGNDTMIGGTGNDTMNGGTGNDSMDAGDGNDSLDGDTGNDVVNGGIGNDALVGGTGDDLLNGGDGNDTLDGGTDFDSISGGAGDDRIIWEPLDIATDGGIGIDTLFLNASSINLSVAAVSAIEVIDMTGGGANTLTLSALDVIAVSDNDTITIIGDSGDTVDGGGGWTPAGTDINGNNIFTQTGGFGTATLVIDPDVAFI